MSPHSQTISIVPSLSSAMPRFRSSICSLTFRKTASFAPIRRVRSSSAIRFLASSPFEIFDDFARVTLLLHYDICVMALHDDHDVERRRLVPVDVEKPRRIRPHPPVVVEPEPDDVLTPHVGALADERQWVLAQVVLGGEGTDALVRGAEGRVVLRDPLLGQPIRQSASRQVTVRRDAGLPGSAGCPTRARRII